MEKTIIEQFNDLKSKHPEALQLFRCGDFYETYNEDAEDVSKILGITLTKRNTGKEEDRYAMAGFPYHALDTYLPKLILAGKRVAICDQLEEPKKKVKRGITEVVEPAPAPQSQAEPQAEEMSATGAPTLLELVSEIKQSVNVINTLTEKLENEIAEKDKEIERLRKELEQEREKVARIAELIK